MPHSVSVTWYSGARSPTVKRSRLSSATSAGSTEPACRKPKCEVSEADLLVAPQKQRGAAVRTFVVHDPDPARRVTERDQLLAEQHQPYRRAVALQFGRHCRRQPILPHQIPHDGARPDADQIFA